MKDIQVVLVDEQDQALGVVEKLRAHREGLLHRAFSIYIFNSRNELLLQKRAAAKYHAAGLWTNTCCGHPLPDERIEQAAHRRLLQEMGFDCLLEKKMECRYETSVGDGMIENEYLHVFFGWYEGQIAINKEEVEDFEHVPVKELENQIGRYPHQYTPWFRLIVPQILFSETPG
ncbi:isopentenyl-diphosphate Delta-isomerase [Dyadobacter jiangsuensis]|uniref:Isopentenyl-diphosphate delta-isomerase n=1 Tax=Dyadobacter jiangsuensis TaxID=1591085 RepID=A0A2P8FI90_9BACT|nr:isopentenyl-diphosphate Delta-isomerase [Dyadobacter jiangsuensis]PSL21430.1 isopentenyl-diphosphate delta-isomerase [Dyadobacter jiangsuensis]